MISYIPVCVRMCIHALSLIAFSLFFSFSFSFLFYFILFFFILHDSLFEAKLFNRIKLDEKKIFQEKLCTI